MTWVFRRELRVGIPAGHPMAACRPGWSALHPLFLLAIVVFAHYPAAFIAVLLLFLGVATAYPAFQGRLILREGLLVGFFLRRPGRAGGMQQWWLQPVLLLMDETQVYFGAVALMAITDNAALTYLGSLVEGLSPGFQYAGDRRRDRRAA